MKILIISDTHKRHTNFDRILKEVGKIDMLIHLGDTEGGEDYMEAAAGCECHIMAGNNDFFSPMLLREEELYLGKYKVFLTHGHGYYVSLGPERIKQEARERGADIVMFGHTHRPLIDLGEDVIAINPGSVSYPRQEGKKPSYIVMEIDDEENAHFSLQFLD